MLAPMSSDTRPDRTPPGPPQGARVIPGIALLDCPPFEPGIVVRTRRRTLTDGDFAMLINATWEDHSMHTDDEFASASPSGRRVLGGPCLLAVAAGLSTELLYAMWGRAGLECITALGIDTLRYWAPVHPGDTVQLEMHIAALEPTPGGSALTCLIKDRVLKQGDVVTMSMERRYLLKQR